MERFCTLIALCVTLSFTFISCEKKDETDKVEMTMTFTGAPNEVTLMTLDPGHFHAALIQKETYPQVSPNVYVFAPEGPDVKDHLNRIDGFNSREDNPTQWQEQTYTADDFLEKMLKTKPGNVVVLSGNNQKKTQYIKACVDAGLNVLADKPMCINADDFKLLQEAFASAKENNVLLYDIMTERSEFTTILQKELSQNPQVFGKIIQGSPQDPAVVKESVHHFFKIVSGNPIKRPPWYFDTTQQGEGLVDVTNHLVDLVMWECFENQIIDYKTDIKLISARRWPTLITRDQFKKVTRLNDFPPYLKDKLDSKATLPCYSNGEMVYTLKGIHVKVSVIWNFQAPPRHKGHPFFGDKRNPIKYYHPAGQGTKLSTRTLCGILRPLRYETRFRSARRDLRSSKEIPRYLAQKRKTALACPDTRQIPHRTRSPFSPGHRKIPQIPRGRQASRLGSPKHDRQILHHDPGFSHCRLTR